MIVTHEQETNSTQRTSFEVMIFNMVHQSFTNAELIHILGTVMEFLMGFTLENTVPEIFHFRI
jgi:hypothetical protein